jgi:hypothetical protein
VRIVFLMAMVYLMTSAYGIGQDSKDQGAKGGAAKSSATTPESTPQLEAAKVLRALEGTWSITENLAPDATSPNGGKGEGREVWRSGPGGYSVVEEYQSRGGNRDISGLGVLWWDDAAHGFRTIWCDSTNPTGCISFKHPIHWEGANLVLVEDYEMKGKKFTFKEVFGDITPQSFTQTLYGAEAGSPLKVDQVIYAKRVAAAGK